MYGCSRRLKGSARSDLSESRCLSSQRERRGQNLPPAFTVCACLCADHAPPFACLRHRGRECDHHRGLLRLQALCKVSGHAWRGGFGGARGRGDSEAGCERSAAARRGGGGGSAGGGSAALPALTWQACATNRSRSRQETGGGGVPERRYEWTGYEVHREPARRVRVYSVRQTHLH